MTGIDESSIVTWYKLAVGPMCIWWLLFQFVLKWLMTYCGNGAWRINTSIIVCPDNEAISIDDLIPMIQPVLLILKAIVIDVFWCVVLKVMTMTRKSWPAITDVFCDICALLNLLLVSQYLTEILVGIIIVYYGQCIPFSSNDNIGTIQYYNTDDYWSQPVPAYWPLPYDIL